MSAPKPRGLEVPLVDLYMEQLSREDFTLVADHSLKLLQGRTTFGLYDAAESWTEAILMLLIRRGMLRSIDTIQAEVGLKK